jgi:hypothetical protein
MLRTGGGAVLIRRKQEVKQISVTLIKVIMPSCNWQKEKQQDRQFSARASLTIKAIQNHFIPSQVHICSNIA